MQSFGFLCIYSKISHFGKNFQNTIEKIAYKYSMKKIVFTGGGTLGHYSPNEALFERLKGEFECVYIGSKNGIEKNFASKLMPYFAVETAKLDRTKFWNNFLIPFKLAKGIREAKKILKEQKPDIVFSKGGYVSVPVVIASKKLGIPCLTHESDYTLGLANRLISKKCKFVCTSFEETAKSTKNGIWTGSIVRDKIFCGNGDIVQKKYNLDKNKKTILVVGGSLGAENLNTALRSALPNLTQYNILHLTGMGKLDKNVNAQNYHQIEFANDIENFFDASDIVITRGGSNTIFELLALKKPMIIVPLESGRGDQILNAKAFEQKCFSKTLREKDISAQNIQNLIAQIEKDYNKISLAMQKNQKDGTYNVCKLIKSICKG